MPKLISTVNGQTILPNRGISKQGFDDSSQEMMPLQSSEQGKSKVCSIKDLGGILARPGQKTISLAEMDGAIVFGAQGRGKS